MLLSCNVKLIFFYLDLFRQVQSPGNNITLGWELGAWPGYSLHYLTCFSITLYTTHPVTNSPALKPALHPHFPKHYSLDFNFLFMVLTQHATLSSPPVPSPSPWQPAPPRPAQARLARAVARAQHRVAPPVPRRTLSVTLHKTLTCLYSNVDVHKRFILFFLT